MTLTEIYSDEMHDGNSHGATIDAPSDLMQLTRAMPDSVLIRLTDLDNDIGHVHASAQSR